MIKLSFSSLIPRWISDLGFEINLLWTKERFGGWNISLNFKSYY